LGDFCIIIGLNFEVEKKIKHTGNTQRKEMMERENRNYHLQAVHHNNVNLMACMIFP
jgi:hypothetical protein